MKVRLSVQHKKANVKSVILHTDALIGRSTECNLRLASGQVSRRHCKLLISDEQVAVIDLGSSNGTFLNDEKIAAKVEIPIPPGSALSIGPARFVVEYDDPAAETHIRKGASSGSAGANAAAHLTPEETPTADAIPVHSADSPHPQETADPEAELEISDEELEALLAEEGFEGGDSPGIDFPLEDDSHSGATPTSDTIPYKLPEEESAQEEFPEDSSTLSGSESNSDQTEEDGDEDVMKFLQDLD